MAWYLVGWQVVKGFSGNNLNIIRVNRLEIIERRKDLNYGQFFICFKSR